MIILSELSSFISLITNPKLNNYKTQLFLQKVSVLTKVPSQKACTVKNSKVEKGSRGVQEISRSTLIYSTSTMEKQR
jgi:hypothetical protein